MAGHEEIELESGKSHERYVIFPAQCMVETILKRELFEVPCGGEHKTFLPVRLKIVPRNFVPNSNFVRATAQKGHSFKTICPNQWYQTEFWLQHPSAYDCHSIILDSHFM